MIKLFWSPRTRATRVHWMLEELGEPYELVRIDLRDPASRSNPDFVAASPMSKVPAIDDGEVAMADSAAICMYLADRYPDMVEEVRGKGLLVGLKLKADVPNTKVRDAARDRKLLIGVAGENVVRMAPPLIVSGEDASKALEILDEALASVRVEETA